MRKINVLDKCVSNLIAAGEVVERPASVVKELVENSIDAGASKIIIEIKNGGISLIKISDNGSGIYRDDVKNAFLRHATSKVYKAEDLNSIRTLGFRGEALSSICAVSRVEIITSCDDEIVGTRYLIEGGEEKLFEDAGRARGTTFVVRDLFFNTPARMKFLKKDIAEANAISSIVDKIAMSHPEVAIKFIRDGKITIDTSGDGKLSSCVYSIYGKEIFENLIPINYELNGIKVSGFISRPEASRPSRSLQNFFINKRYAKIKIASVAIEEAYKGYIMSGKYPICAVYIDVSPEAVDVNVHPAKTEVRFVNERPIFEAVYNAVKTALLGDNRKKSMQIELSSVNKNPDEEIEKAQDIISKADKEIAPQIYKKTRIDISDKTKSVSDFKESEFDNSKNDLSAEIFVPKKAEHGNSILNLSLSDVTRENTRSINSFFDVPQIANNQNKIVNRNSFIDSCIADLSKEYKEKNADKLFKSFELANNNEKENVKIEGSKVNNKLDTKFESQHYDKIENDNPEEKIEINKQSEENAFTKFNSTKNVLGEVFNCYIVVQENNKLVFIDKHAAHERIIYNKLKKDKKITDSQILLKPIVISLDKNEYSALIQNLNLLADSGYDVEDFGEGNVIVRSAPVYLDISDVESTVIEIAGYILSNKVNLDTEYLEWLYHNIACRAAIKAGKSSSKEELVDLIETLDNNPDVRYCPHGRPIYIELSKKDIEKQFGRT